MQIRRQHPRERLRDRLEKRDDDDVEITQVRPWHLRDSWETDWEKQKLYQLQSFIRERYWETD